MTLKQRKRNKKIKKILNDIKIAVTVIYSIVNAGQGMVGTMDERWKQKEKQFKRIEYAFPGYRLGRKIEKVVDPAITYLFGEWNE